MKTLLIFRHGKAERDAPQGDTARALTPRGVRDTEAMARYLAGLVGSPDRVVTSDARRAQQTAALAAHLLGCTEAVTTLPAVYGAGLDALEHIVRQLSDSADCVLLVGHNPGLEELGASLAESGTPEEHLPTAGVLHLEFDAPHWRDVRPGTGRVRGLYAPETLPPAT